MILKRAQELIVQFSASSESQKYLKLTSNKLAVGPQGWKPVFSFLALLTTGSPYNSIELNIKLNMPYFL